MTAWPCLALHDGATFVLCCWCWCWCWLVLWCWCWCDSQGQTGYYPTQKNASLPPTDGSDGCTFPYCVYYVGTTSIIADALALKPSKDNCMSTCMILVVYVCYWLLIELFVVVVF